MDLFYSKIIDKLMLRFVSTIILFFYHIVFCKLVKATTQCPVYVNESQTIGNDYVFTESAVSNYSLNDFQHSFKADGNGNFSISFLIGSNL